MNKIEISEKYFLQFKELTREQVGEEEFNKMTNQDLMSSAIALITFMEAVYRHINKDNY